MAWRQVNRAVLICGSMILMLGWGMPVYAATEAPVPATLYWWDYVFYSIALTAIFLYSAILVTLRAYDWLYLGITGLLVLLLISSLDGSLATLLGAGSEFMGISPLMIGAVTFGFQLAGSAWRIKSPHKYARFKKPLYGFAALSFSLIPGYFLIDSMVPLYSILNTLFLVSVVATIFAPLSWDHLSRTLHRMAILLPVTTATLAITAYGAHFLGDGFSRPVLDGVNRLVIFIYIAYSLGFGLIYVLEEITTRQRAERKAERAALEAAENALALHEAKEEFEHARLTAERRSRQLAEASHDIRQPLGALRHAIRDIQAEQPTKDTQPILQAIDYLEELAGSYIQPDLPSAAGEISRDEQDRERVSGRLILDTVHHIHAGQASEQAVRIELEDDGTDIMLRPLSMVRVLSNLVANALDHAKPSEVVLGFRQTDDGQQFYVADDGVGMTADQLDERMQVGVKGEDSAGSGYGLGIVQSQASGSGWQLKVDTALNEGTRVTILVPQ